MNLKKHARGFMIAYPSANRIVRKIRSAGRDKPHDDFWFLRHLQAAEGTVLVDAGANVGQSVRALRGTLPDTPIHAFEPSASAFAKLRDNTAGLPAVTLHQTALFDVPGEMTIYTPAYDGRPMSPLSSLDYDSAAQWLTRFGGIFIDERKVTVRKETVAVARLDDYGLAPSFIKIDVQGVAPRLLRGGEATIAAHRPVLFVERDPDDDIAEQLAPLSYRDYVLREGKLVPYAGQKDSIMVSTESTARLDLPLA